MNKSDFDYFMALYNTESLSKAATVCHTDKSTISKSIIKLEKDLNTKLFDRENGRYIPLRSCAHLAKFIVESDLSYKTLLSSLNNLLFLNLYFRYDFLAHIIPDITAMANYHELSLRAKNEFVIDKNLISITNDTDVYLDLENQKHDSSVIYKRIGYMDIYAYLGYENKYAKKESLCISDLSSQIILLSNKEKQVFNCLSSHIEDTIQINNSSLDNLKRVKDSQNCIALSVDSAFANPTITGLKRTKVEGVKLYYGLYYHKNIEERIDPFINQMTNRFNQE